MITCSRCRKRFERENSRCPHCGQANPAKSGTFQTSTVLISARGSERVYRSVDEVPKRLRTRLLKSTNGANSATILIADRRGKEELAKAIRRLPGNTQQRLLDAVFGSSPDTGVTRWLKPYRRTGLAVVMALFVTLVIWFALTHWRG